jgi:hypothetical protein
MALGLAGASNSPALMYPNFPENTNIWHSQGHANRPVSLTPGAFQGNSHDSLMRARCEEAPESFLDFQLVAALQVQNLAGFIRRRYLKPQAFDDLAGQRHLLRIGGSHPARRGP